MDNALVGEGFREILEVRPEVRFGAVPADMTAETGEPDPVLERLSPPS